MFSLFKNKIEKAPSASLEGANTANTTQLEKMDLNRKNKPNAFQRQIIAFSVSTEFPPTPKQQA
tara:strand:- start:6187 stop:6378 length:192 start_codon:yes stop_codon:yes gene_type:complete